ncbi:response regulator transcription factor [Paenibacillus sp. SYP-B3998]|uniref:Response regulator transcription factor n=1 Tax=Paenibacillus sp. SYP-B3998 TaxID=2678564 RepID=A0A6G3ZZR4_9BACL|nr:response regulator transcription factor [Paenibacillus sp. SYP-B3998]NEW07716.1 response regulator transcription factor [Paenibacillus sp. SYP-B3998]
MWKILIIDDDFQVLEGMKKSIPWEAIDAQLVGEASDGAEGLEMVKRTHPDIVITDIYMPVMNGLEMIEKLREDQFPGELIILSGYADFQFARQALRLQVSDYLSKPVTIEELSSVLSKVIKELEIKEMKKVEQEEIRNKLMMVEPFVQKEWLKSVITGTFDKSKASQSFQLSEQTQWLYRSHLVMGIELMSTVRTANLSLIDWNLFRFALANIIREILAEDWPESDFVELHSHHAAIMFHILPATEREEAKKTIRSIGKRIADCVLTYLQLSIRLGLGQEKRDWQEISDSTEEAFLDLLQQTIIPAQGEQSVIPSGNDVSMRPIKFYQQLAEAIVYAKEETAKQIVDAYIQQLQSVQTVNPPYLQYLCTELWTIFAYSLYSVGTVLDELFPDMVLQQEIVQIKTPEQLKQWLHRKIHLIASSRHWNENSKHKEAVEFMIQYAHDHYAQEISLEDMSKQLYLSRNYLNQIFKKATGETFTNYLIRVRMKKAHALLAEGKYLIYEISEKVGYKNVPYFSSIFKKYNGINPSEVGKSGT